MLHAEVSIFSENHRLCLFIINIDLSCGSYVSTRVNIKKARLGLYTVYLPTAV